MNPSRRPAGLSAPISARISVYVTEPVHPEAQALLVPRRARVDVGDEHVTPEELRRRVADVDVILSKTDPVPIDSGIIDAAPRLRLIARHGSGYSNVDLDHATDRGIVVTNTPGCERGHDCRVHRRSHDCRGAPAGTGRVRLPRRSTRSPGLPGPPALRQDLRHRRRGPDRPGSGPAGVRAWNARARPPPPTLRPRPRRSAARAGRPRHVARGKRCSSRSTFRSTSRPGT